MMNVTRTIASIALAAAVGGCWTGVYEDPAAQYIRRMETITTSAGNAKDINAATHVIDPWPRRVANRRIVGNGARMTRAVGRYQSGQGPGGQTQTGPQVIGIPVGAATPPTSSTGGSSRCARAMIRPRPAFRSSLSGSRKRRNQPSRVLRSERSSLIPAALSCRTSPSCWSRLLAWHLLALDGARYMSLQTQLQNGADAFALAGAAELDRLPDSETRAVDAITRLLTNATLFGGEGDRNVGGLQYRILQPDSPQTTVARFRRA